MMVRCWLRFWVISANCAVDSDALLLDGDLKLRREVDVIGPKAIETRRIGEVRWWPGNAAFLPFMFGAPLL